MSISVTIDRWLMTPSAVVAVRFYGKNPADNEYDLIPLLGDEDCHRLSSTDESKFIAESLARSVANFTGRRYVGLSVVTEHRHYAHEVKQTFQ